MESAGVQPPFGPVHAEVYEITYRSRGKDWAAEAGELAARIRDRRPAAVSLLDVGCGSGVHLETFRRCFDHVEGLELAPAMRERARRRLPGVPVHAGDMRDFDLGRRFDAVTCLAAFGYVGSVAELRAAVRRISRHVLPGGVVAVEPWWLAENYVDGYVGSDLVRDGDGVVARVSHTQKRGRTAHMEARWLVGGAAGIRSFTVTEAFTLFTKDEYLTAFEDAGCAVEYEEPWLTGRGIFIGVSRPTAAG